MAVISQRLTGEVCQFYNSSVPRPTMLGLIVGLALVCGVPSPFSYAQTFRADTLSVEVDARVIDRHHEFVRDLKQSEFVLRDDGKEQVITTFAVIDLPRDPWSGSPSRPTP